MSAVCCTLGTAGAGEQIEALGREWTLAHTGPGIRSRYSAWVLARARRDLVAERPYLPDEQYREALALLQDRIDQGAYSWGSPLDPRGIGSAISAAMASTAGQLRLIQELLRPAHGDVDLETVLGIVEESPDLVGLVVAACMALPGHQQDPDEDDDLGEEHAQEGDSEEQQRGLTDQDLLGLFAREPFQITPAVYAGLSDRQILKVYLAPRDDDGDLIPECDQDDRGSREDRKRRRWHRRRIEAAGKELPPVEDLKVPDEVIHQGVQMSYVLMYWQVWRGRGLTSEQVLEKWRAEHHGKGT